MTAAHGAGSVALAGVTLPPRWARHPVVAAENVRPGWDASHVWFDDDALLVRLRWRERTDAWRWSQHTLAVEVDDAGHSLLAVGSPAGAARLLLQAADRLAPVVRTSVPRGTHAAVRRAAAEHGLAVPAPFLHDPVNSWDWFSVSEPVPVPDGGERVTELVGDAGRSVAADCLAVANPGGELDPDEPRSRWWGWLDDDGRARAVCGASRRVPGQPWVLGSIGTDPAWRGRGLAGAATAVAARAGVAETGAVTLGVYAHNAAALRVYRRLGFVLGQDFESWRA
ncbi:GNAT family N-acetyltransferase [Isoptericola sp. BMS4]|uniref:GNAT family N-acetyltransferase n=1 Tax=Isoptericola sp. BMS4 TaxID=2527875 RepID=UPI001420674B|nr:GNAT family N-acetyltransferase [Isoptericola sp. BMS4]